MEGVEEFDRLLDDLVEAGVFEESDDGHLRPTEAFGRHREASRAEVARFDESEFASTLEAYGADPGSADDVDATVLGDAMAMFDMVEGADRERSLVAARALAWADVTETAPEVPDGFVPLDGEEIEPFVRRHPAAVVYFWREDCEPCDDVRAHLETLLAGGHVPDAVGLGAVYGPDSAELIRERYQVAAAPTTLFFRNGAVDSRLVGDMGYAAVRMEVETIAEGLD